MSSKPRSFAGSTPSLSGFAVVCGLIYRWYFYHRFQWRAALTSERRYSAGEEGRFVIEIIQEYWKSLLWDGWLSFPPAWRLRCGC